MMVLIALPFRCRCRCCRWAFNVELKSYLGDSREVEVWEFTRLLGRIT